MEKALFIKSMKRLSKSLVIIDVGGGDLWQKNLSSRKNLFIKSQCYSVDRSPASNPSVRADIHRLPFKNGCCNGVICKAVLEHSKKPWIVVEEIYRILKFGGKAYFWVPFIYPYHPNKNYGDYFRFTISGIKELLSGFKDIEISSSLGYFSTVAGLLPGILPKFFWPATKFLDQKIPISGQCAGWHVLVTK